MAYGLFALAWAPFLFLKVVERASLEARDVSSKAHEFFDVAEGLAFRTLATGLPENGWLCWALVLLVTGEVSTGPVQCRAVSTEEDDVNDSPDNDGWWRRIRRR